MAVEEWYGLDKNCTNAVSEQRMCNELVAIPKYRDTLRILALGDSRTEGQGLELKGTSVKLLEQSLQAEFPGQTNEVINAGIGGYGVGQEYIWLRECGLGFQSEIVLLTVYLNAPSPFQPPSRVYAARASRISI